MKRLLYITLFMFVLISCKEDSLGDYANAADVESLGGKWYLSEVEKTTIDNKNVWERVKAGPSDTLIFRADGVILQPDGLPMCCSPKSLLINGRLMDIKPQSTLPANGYCASVNCVFCPLWELTFHGNELIITSCNKTRQKFVR